MDPRVRTTIFLAILTLLLLAVGQYFGGLAGVAIMLVFSILINFGTYFYSDKIVLKMYNAKPVNKDSHPLLYGLVESLSQRANLPMPKVYIIPSNNPNAFATGRNPEHAAVAATTGILDLLSKKELEGVIAHELSHVKNRDILISTVAATIAGVISYLSTIAQWTAIFGGFGRDGDGDSNIISLLVMIILAPLIAMVLQMAISRSREYLADKSGAEMLHSGEGLASALEKIEAGVRKRPMRMGNTGTAHLFIQNPFSGRNMIQLFSTHPSTASRVEKLRRMKW